MYVSSSGAYRSCNVCLILFLALSNQATYKSNEIMKHRDYIGVYHMICFCPCLLEINIFDISNEKKCIDSIFTKQWTMVYAKRKK
jgi:hypothetical protein